MGVLSLKDPDPAWNGYSIGRWEGDTFVRRIDWRQPGLCLVQIGWATAQSLRGVYRSLAPGGTTIRASFNDTHDPKLYQALVGE